MRGEDACRVEAGGRPRTGRGRIVTLDSVSEWRRTGERGAAATGGYIHYIYRLQSRDSLLWCLQFVVLPRVNFTGGERVTNICIDQ